MDRDGHLGMAFLVYFGVLNIFNLYSSEYLVIGLLTAFFSSLPDIDIRLRIRHRGITHSIFTGILIGVGVGYLFNYIGLGFYIGFLPVFLGYILHILGDLLTYHPFKPLYPISKRSISLKLFRSDNPFVNKSLLMLGVSVFVVYVLRMSGIHIF